METVPDYEEILFAHLVFSVYEYVVLCIKIDIGVEQLSGMCWHNRT